VNPYKEIKGLYSDRAIKARDVSFCSLAVADRAQDYRGKYPYELPPHIFALSDQV
jgi:myosin heavy subunit